MTKRVRASGLIALLFAVCLTSLVRAQTSWWKTYGGTGDDEGRSVRQTTDGGYIVAGYTRPSGLGFTDVYLIKVNAQGETLWARIRGGLYNDDGYSVQQTTDGGYIIVGYTCSFGEVNGDVYSIKTHAEGDTLWTRTYGGLREDIGYSVQQTTDGGYIIAGSTRSFGHDSGYNDVYVIKTNAQGDTLWTRTYGGTKGDEARSVVQTADSGYIMAGWTFSFGAGGLDVYLVKTDEQGDTLWTRTYGGANIDLGWSVQQTTDGGYIVAGHTISLGAGGYDVYLIKLTASGDTLWTRTYGGSRDDIGCSVQQTTDGGYSVTGYTCSFGAGTPDSANAYLIKTDSSGATLWTRTYGGMGDDQSCSAQQTTDGGYIITGYSRSFSGEGNDVYLIKTDSLGNVGLAEQNREQRVSGRKPAATIIRSLLPGAVAFDATGRRAMTAKSGVLFVRDRSAVNKVILQR